MTVSKRLRYEVLRRDNHACRYCGAAAPEAKLTIDHVVPQALGGSDDPSNLVACCIDCNAGKSSSTPDAPLVAEVSEDALRWGRAVQVAAQTLLTGLGELAQARREFFDAWNVWTFGPPDNRQTVPLDPNWRDSLDAMFARGLPMEVIKECIGIAMRRKGVAIDNVFRYFCGVAWRKVDELTSIAKDVYDSLEVDSDGA